MEPLLSSNIPGMIEWCTFCGAAPSDGHLTFDLGVDDKGEIEYEDFPSCTKCAIQFSDGYSVEGVDH